MATFAAPAADRSPWSGPGAVHRSPPLALLGGVFTALFLASLVVGMTMTGGAPHPTPYDPPEAARAYYGPHPDAIRIIAFLQLGAAIVLGIYTATVTSRLHFLGLNVAGVTIGLVGGAAASVLLAVSALTTWVMTQPGIADDLTTLRALQLFAFAVGGPGHVAAFGLLLAGVSIPAAFARLMPRWLVWLGLILAVLAELSTLSLVFPSLSVLIPLARFPALIWVVGAGLTLPTARSSGRVDEPGAAA